MSYLSFKYDGNLSSLHTLRCSQSLCPRPSSFRLVHYPSQYSDLCPFPLSHDHHLYADNTQLFLSFHPLNFDSSTSQLQNAFQKTSSWTTANLKTEFLLIGLKYQLAKIHNASLNTSHSAQNLSLSLTNILPSLTKLRLSPKAVTITFVNFAVSGLTSICQLLPLLPLSFTPNLITVIPCTINSLSLNYPVSSRSRTLLLVMSLNLLSPVISLPSYALSTGSQ